MKRRDTVGEDHKFAQAIAAAHEMQHPDEHLDNYGETREADRPPRQRKR